MTTNTDTTAASGAASQPEALLQAALKTLDWYAAGNHEVTLSGRIDWAAERARLEAAGYSSRGESYNGEEHFCETGGKAEGTAATIRAALAAPAAQEAEPVVTVQSYTNGSYSRNYKLQWHRDVPEGTKLYAHPPRPQAGAVAVPEGWRLVPVEPTPGMLSVGAYNVQCDYENTIETIARHAYRAMLAAAPQAPAAPTLNVSEER